MNKNKNQKNNYPKQRYTGEKPWMDKDWLYNEYVIKDRSSKDIADEYGCKPNTIQSWLSKHKIKKKIVRQPKPPTKQYQFKDYLYNEHIINKKSIAQIARENNVSSDTIRRYLIQYNIDYWVTTPTSILTQDDINNIIYLYKDCKISANQISKQYNTDHSVIIRALKRNNIPIRNQSETQFAKNKKEIDDRFNDKNWLYKVHWEENKSCKEIGDMLGVDAGTMRRQMHRLGLQTKNNSESKIGLMSGDKHPNWKGGKTELNQLLREYFHINLAPIVAERDNYTCQLCGATHTVLHVHHIKHFADIVDEILKEHSNLNPDNSQDKIKLYDICVQDKRFLDENNLITLCKTCHQHKIHGKTISSQASIEEGSETIQ